MGTMVFFHNGGMVEEMLRVGGSLEKFPIRTATLGRGCTLLRDGASRLLSLELLVVVMQDCSKDGIVTIEIHRWYFY